jgi:RNA polymerase sigma-70 factor, ECF subfamily
MLECVQFHNSDSTVRLRGLPPRPANVLESGPMPTPLDPAAVTMLLERWNLGDAKAVEKLLPLIYEELRSIARSYMSRERPGHTLGATGLVHEAFLRLNGHAPDSWRDRKHFYGIAARLMREVLVDYSRHHGAQKRDPSLAERLPPVNLESHTPRALQADYILLDECLRRLEQRDPRKAQIVELRFYGGLTLEEIGEAMELSVSMVKKELTLAKVWLFAQIQSEGKQ